MKSKKVKHQEAINRNTAYKNRSPALNLELQRSNGHADTTKQSKRLLEILAKQGN